MFSVFDVPSTVNPFEDPIFCTLSAHRMHTVYYNLSHAITILTFREHVTPLEWGAFIIVSLSPQGSIDNSLSLRPQKYDGPALLVLAPDSQEPEFLVEGDWARHVMCLDENMFFQRREDSHW